MSGLYFHIPFCTQACNYCDFHFSTSLSKKDSVLEAMLEELRQRVSYLPEGKLKTIYFGGGTPSILPISDLENFFREIHRYFMVEEGAEITLEANPEDLLPEKIMDWKKLGINRLSIGVQSFRDEDLRLMNRIHTAEEASVRIKQAQNLGFDNISIDLIYGIPGQPDEAWKENLKKVIDLKIQHISAYCLTIESKTVFDHMVKKGKMEPVDQDAAAHQFLLLQETLKNAGFEQYEVSNFSLPGNRSRHNSSYWTGSAFLGIGPSAHSYNGSSRRWNIANNMLYIRKIKAGEMYWDEETLTMKDRWNETIMTGLRTSSGISISDFQKTFQDDPVSAFPEIFESWNKKGMLVLEDDKLVLTPKGLLMADRIASDFFKLAPHESTT